MRSPKLLARSSPSTSFLSDLRVAIIPKGLMVVEKSPLHLLTVILPTLREFAAREARATLSPFRAACPRFHASESRLDPAVQVELFSQFASSEPMSGDGLLLFL